MGVPGSRWIGRAIESARQAIDPRERPVAGELLLVRQRVYILPTKAGLGFGAVLLVMLVTAINYSLALGHALTFLLAGVGVVSMIHTWRMLVGIVLRPGRADPVQAGDLAEFGAMLCNTGRLHRYAIELALPGGAQAARIDLEPRSEQLVSIALPTSRRGWLEVPRLRLSCTFPLGLWRAWAWWRPAARVLVHPRAEPPGAPLPATSTLPGPAGGASSGDEDFAALRGWRDGDSPSRVAWKAVARSGGERLLSMQFDGGLAADIWLDWGALPTGMGVEARLSRLVRWVIDADQSGARWGLRLPGRTIAVDSGPIHRAACLEALALADV